MLLVSYVMNTGAMIYEGNEIFSKMKKWEVNLLKTFA